MADPAQFALGVLILLAPGVALTWAMVGPMDWAKTFVVGVIAAVSIPPFTMYLLNVFLGVPFTLANIVLIALAVTLLAAARGLQKRLARPTG